MKKILIAASAAMLLTSAAPVMARGWWVPVPHGPSTTADPYSIDTWVGCSDEKTCAPGDGKNRPLAYVRGSRNGYEYSSDDERAPWNNGDFGDPDESR
jgi:hypothetical protein